jgi:hypothetical protein
MINATRQNNQIALLQPNPHPVISLTPDIKVPRTIQNVPDLLVLVEMLVEEGLHFFFVNVAHLLRADGDFIPIFVVAGCGDGVNTRDFGDAVVDDAELGEVIWVYRAAGVVGLALVALVYVSMYENRKGIAGAYGKVVEPVCLHFGVDGILEICCLLNSSYSRVKKNGSGIGQWETLEII